VQDSRRVIQAARSAADGGGAAGWCGGGARGEVRQWTAVGRLSVGFFLAAMLREGMGAEGSEQLLRGAGEAAGGC
jgi:hypothetical protein